MMSAQEKITCISCKKTPSQQRVNRYMGMMGDRCIPGRCIVKGTVWRTMPDGSPVDWDMNKVEARILQNYHEVFG